MNVQQTLLNRAAGWLVPAAVIMSLPLPLSAATPETRELYHVASTAVISATAEIFECMVISKHSNKGKHKKELTDRNPFEAVKISSALTFLNGASASYQTLLTDRATVRFTRPDDKYTRDSVDSLTREFMKEPNPILRDEDGKGIKVTPARLFRPPF